MSKCILEYLFNGNGSALYGTNFNDLKYWSSTPYVREGYAYDYFKGLIHNNITASFKSVEEQEYFTHIFEKITFEVNSLDRYLLNEWINIKKSYCSENYYDFIINTSQFLTESISKQYDIIKILLIYDIKRVIKSTSYKNSNDQIFLQKIDQFINYKTFGNNYLKDSFKGTPLDKHTNNEKRNIDNYKIIFPEVSS